MLTFNKKRQKQSKRLNYYRLWRQEALNLRRAMIEALTALADNDNKRASNILRYNLGAEWRQMADTTEEKAQEDTAEQPKP